MGILVTLSLSKKKAPTIGSLRPESKSLLLDCYAQDLFSMSIRIQWCHPQVHTTHIDFKMSHSLKRSLEAKSGEISHLIELTLIDVSSDVGDMHVARDRMHDGG